MHEYNILGQKSVFSLKEKRKISSFWAREEPRVAAATKPAQKAVGRPQQQLAVGTTGGTGTCAYHQHFLKLDRRLCRRQSCARVWRGAMQKQKHSHIWSSWLSYFFPCILGPVKHSELQCPSLKNGVNRNMSFREHFPSLTGNNRAPGVPIKDTNSPSAMQTLFCRSGKSGEDAKWILNIRQIWETL